MSSEWKRNLRVVFRRLLASRAAAALVALVTASYAAVVLPDGEYALASVVISYGAILTALLYSPFAKFALVGNDRTSLHSIFLKFQVVVATIATLTVVAGAWMLEAVGVPILVAGVVFASAQGAKFYFGDMARAEGNIAAVGWLYLADAVTTLAVVIPALYVFPSADAYLFTSSASTFFWCVVLFRSRAVGNVDAKQFISGLGHIYRYSVGVVGVQGLNATTMATARTALVIASPPGVAGQVQLLLDLLQRPIALIASSITSVIVPEMAKERESGHIAIYASWTMIFVFGLSLFGAVATAIILPIVSPDGPSMGIGMAVLCTLLTWANRYKSAVLESPLVANIRASWFLLLGGLVSLLLTLIAIEVIEAMEGIAAAAAACLLIGGYVSACAAAINGLISSRQLAMVCLPSAVVAMVVTLGTL